MNRAIQRVRQNEKKLICRPRSHLHLQNTIAHENGLTTTYGHDAGGQALTVHTRNPGNTLLSGITHTLDAAGRRISATYEDNLGQAYAYDAAGQLTHGRVGISNASQANAKQSSTHAYSYDPAGNRQSSLAFGQTSSYTTNSLNAYTSISGGGFQAPSPSYDANGNTLSLPRPDGTSQALAWDTHNRLRSVNATSAQMTYDPRGRLVWIRNTNGTNPATEYLSITNRETRSEVAATRANWSDSGRGLAFR